jgi:hypothetical protein
MAWLSWILGHPIDVRPGGSGSRELGPSGRACLGLHRPWARLCFGSG